MKCTEAYRWLSCLFVLVALPCAIHAGNTQHGTFQVIESTEHGWLLEYTFVPPSEVLTTIDGVIHVVYLNSDRDPGREGEPMLPVEVATLGIPAGATLQAEVVDPIYHSQSDVNIAPIPGHLISQEGEAIEVFRKDPAAYSRSTYVPETNLVLDPVVRYRQRSLASIRLFPIQYNPATRTAKRLMSARILVRLNAGSKSISPGTVENDSFLDRLLTPSLLNAEESRHWQSQRTNAEAGGPDPTRSWFETGRIYYKIPVARDGWYRITKDDLAAAGADPSTIEPSSIKLFYRGVQIPVVVRPDTSVEFFGRRNYGDTTYIDFYADTSAYWLTWGGDPGVVFSTQVQHSGAHSQTIISARKVSHYEENTGYYQGTTQLEVIQNGIVPGEGWYWERLFPNTTITKPFVLDNVDTLAGPTARMRVRLFSMTADGPATDHHARFWVNDSLLGEIMFEGRTGVTFEATFPSRWLTADTNRFRVTSIPTPSIPNLFYLDWFDIDFQRSLRASANTLEFVSSETSGPAPALFVASGFTTPAIEVYDLTLGRAIVGGTVSGDSASGFTISFKDTFSSARTYLILGFGSVTGVLPVKQKLFTDIRSNPPGADYIIITHKAFRNAAQQLALHRASSHGIRTTLVDVDDIYDEFNYGIFDPTRIKTFLLYAYQHWSAPAPGSVLLFGDASWDFKKYLATSIKDNYVPAYGVPAGDNWFVAFDTTVVPWMNIGRIPVEDSIQASRVVAKIVGYDEYPLDEWNKNFLMITGGNSPGEQSTFNNNTESQINSYLAPPPIGGTPYRVYKATDAVIDGENRQFMRDRIRDGVVFVNFLGHSGGRIWGVDIGSPYDLENTNGRLPFISSVSCNVGAFAEPSNNVLAEDFLIADNRGAIGAWASSSLGYPTPGTLLVNNFLAGVRDSLREFGALTTAARFRLWQIAPGNAIYQAMVNLNPLIGDPLSRLAIPLMPDLAIATSDISMLQQVPTPNDSLLMVKLRFRNYGLVPADSVEVSLTDLFDGETSTVLDRTRIPPVRHRDSLVVAWDASEKVGMHTLTAILDPLHLIPEVNEWNNTASSPQYVYANVLSVVKPIANQVVQPGIQNLVVTSPRGRDSAGFQYYYELDTVASFDSPFHISSGPVVPGAVTGEWQTPSLSDGQVFYWRCRTVHHDLEGNWVTSTFSTSLDTPSPPMVRWKQKARGQFERNTLTQSSVTDSGLTIKPNEPLNLYARSLGNRANLNLDYYSIIRLNELTIVGHWWVLGNSFMVLRVNEFTGAYEFRGFNVAGQASQRDSMRSFINNTPAGHYLAMSVIFDGKTNVNESLYVALEGLGSTMIRSLNPGESWAFIARKGFPASALESMTNDSAIVSLVVPNYYSVGGGYMISEWIPTPAGWDSLAWHRTLTPGTSADVRVLGVRQDNRVDTLRQAGANDTLITLATLDPLTSGPLYKSFRLGAFLTSNDAENTPALREWRLDFTLPADLAISSQTIGVGDESTIRRGEVFNLPVTVHNVGFMDADSARVTVSMYDKFNKARQIAQGTVGAVPVGGSNSTVIPVSTTDFPRSVVLQVSVQPSKREKDLIPDNNFAYMRLNVDGVSGRRVRFFADGIQLMDGDFIAGRSKLFVEVSPGDEVVPGMRIVQFFVNGADAGSVRTLPLRGDQGSGETQRQGVFDLTLSDGTHELTVRAIEHLRLGGLDTLESSIRVNVLSEVRLLQMYNYPNPFSRDTRFTFVLTGTLPEKDLFIRVFTVSGRRIKEIAVPPSTLRIGFNAIPWDGRDTDGDEIANGTYLYQISFEGRGGIRHTGFEKLVKLR